MSDKPKITATLIAILALAALAKASQPGLGDITVFQPDEVYGFKSIPIEDGMTVFPSAYFNGEPEWIFNVPVGPVTCPGLDASLVFGYDLNGNVTAQTLDLSNVCVPPATVTVGENWYFVYPGNLYTPTPFKLDISLVNAHRELDSQEFSFYLATPVPEMGTLWMLATGLIGLVGRSRLAAKKGEL